VLKHSFCNENWQLVFLASNHEAR
jgi:hypothetical protein